MMKIFNLNPSSGLSDDTSGVSRSRCDVVIAWMRSKELASEHQVNLGL